jgi:hypothetical protein
LFVVVIVVVVVVFVVGVAGVYAVNPGLLLMLLLLMLLVLNCFLWVVSYLMACSLDSHIETRLHGLLEVKDSRESHAKMSA